MASVALSIIIPIYNVEKYVNDCLQSIYSQGMDERLFEVFLVDDGGADDSIAVIHPYVEEHKNCTLIRQSHQGLSVARNNGLKHSKGNYVWFVDSDDWIDSGSLQYVIDFVSSGRYDVVATHLLWHYPSIKEAKIDGISKLDNREVNAYSYLLQGSLSSIPRFLIRRQLLLDSGLTFLPGVMHEDCEFGYRLIYYADKIFVSDKSIYHYRKRNDGNITSTRGINNVQSTLLMYKRAKGFAEQVKDEGMRDVIRHRAFMILCLSFRIEDIWHQKDIRELYRQYITAYRYEAKKLIYTSIPMKKKLRAMVCIVSPLLMKLLLRW